MAFSLGEYQEIFLEEADEQLQELNQNLLELEKNPEDLEIINNIFRAAHSLKSSAAFVGLNDLSDLAHMMENLLQGIREGTLGITSEIVDIIFKCFDEIHNIVDTIASGEKPDQDLQWLIDEIQAISDRVKVSEEGSMRRHRVGDANQEMGNVPKTVLDVDIRKAIKNGLQEGNSCIEITVFIDDKAQMKWVKAQLVLSNLGKLGDIITTFPPAEDLNDDDMNNVFKVILVTDADIEDVKRSANVDLVYRIDIKSINLSRKDDKLVLKFGEKETFEGEIEKSYTDAEILSGETSGEDADYEDDFADAEEDTEDEVVLEIQGGVTKQVKKNGEKVEEKRKISSLKTVKVSIDKLDLLLNNVGELVIANSGFYKLYDELRKLSEEKSFINEFKSRMEQMSRIAKDLQSGIMKTRMVPIGQVFTRFRRLVRDLAKEFNKQVELIIKGEETELDKKVIDSIGEPLLHLIRNAIDHGIESQEKRKSIGKSDTAIITLNAYQGGNQIFVEVSDDGNGLNVDQIKAKAIERGLATPEMISAMDNQDIYNFIFTPGFSTAERVTELSGRGVGMNVVKEIVNELNGSVAIETEPGMGTRFVLAFPITLAIIPAIMTRVRREMYAIPLTDVIETIKISQADITTIEGHEVINLRGEILSLLRLNQFIGLKSALIEDQKIPVVVVGFGNRKIGLIVDHLEGKQEIVIKSLEQNYTTVEGLAGASILGDGSICLILDISSMINRVIADQDRLSKFDRKRIIESDEADFEEMDDDLEIEEKLEKPGGRAALRPIDKDMGADEKKKDLFKREDATEIEVSEPVVLESRRERSKIKEEETDVVLRMGETSKKDAALSEREKATEKTLPAEFADEKIRVRVHDTLDEFRKELRESIKSTVEKGGPSDHMISALDLTGEDLNEFQLIANMGATNAAESLSKIIKKRIDLSIPEVVVKLTEQIPKYIGDIDSIYMGIMMPVLGEAKGTVLFIFKEDIGFELIDLLFGTETRKSRKLHEDGESALQELTNIVGSSIINVFADKTGLTIKPGLPTIVHDYMQSVIDSILVLHNMENDYTLVMDTAFYFEDDKIIGNLLMLPEPESFKIIVERMRSNVGSN